MCGQPVDRLKLQSAKLQPKASKCALKLVLCVFTFEELAHGNPSGITTARNAERRKHIHKLDSARMMYIQGEFGTCTLWYKVLTLSFYNYTDFVE